MAPKRVELPANVLDLYNVSSILGSGGFGTVWAATSKATGVDVALKATATPTVSLYQAAWRELKLLKALPPHPHVVYTFDAFDDRKEQQGGDSDGKETANEALKTITGSEGSGPAAKDKSIQVETPAKEEVEGDDYLSSIAQKQQQRTLQQLQQQKQQQQQRRAAQLPPPRLFVVACLELVRGPTLLAMLQAGGALDVGLCRVVAAQLVSALGFLHSHSVVHRDVKPDNVVLEGASIGMLHAFASKRRDAAHAAHAAAASHAASAAVLSALSASAAAAAAYRAAVVADALSALEPAGVGAQSPLAALSLPEGEAVSFSLERSTAPSKAAAKAAVTSAPEATAAAAAGSEAEAAAATAAAVAAAAAAEHALLWGSLPRVRAVLIDFGLARSVSAKAVRRALIQAAEQDKLAGVAPPPGNAQEEALSNSSSSSSSSSSTSSSTSSGSSRVLSVSNLSLMDMSAVGNRLFAAPEILRGARAVPSASGAPRVADYGFCVDSYSLGRTLRHALSGASPEKNESYIFRATTPGLLSCCFGGGGSGGRLGGADDDRPDDAEGLRGDAAADLVRDDDSAAGRRARAQELLCAGKKARAFRSRRELPPQAKDLLAGLLQRDPAKRTSMRAAATHPWCAGVPPWTTFVGPSAGGSSSVADGAARASSGGSASGFSSPSSVPVPWTGALHSSSAAAGGMFRRACGLSSVGLSGVKPSGGRFLDLSGHGNGSDLDASGHAVGLDLSGHG